jgi:hypothetical protein
MLGSRIDRDVGQPGDIRFLGERIDRLDFNKNDCRRFEEILATLKDQGLNPNYNILTSTLSYHYKLILWSFRFVALIRCGNSSV